MTTRAVSNQSRAVPVDVAGGDGAPVSKMLFDMSAIDLSQRVLSKQDIEVVIPHRGHMSLLDGIVWHNAAWSQALAYKKIHDKEFWFEGHFPGKPTFPGVLMIEAGAQLACYTFLAHDRSTSLVLFLRIEHAAFRHAVVPGDDFYILLQEHKRQRRRFISDIMGVVGDKIAFDARISGMMVDERAY